MVKKVKKYYLQQRNVLNKITAKDICKMILLLELVTHLKLFSRIHAEAITFLLSPSEPLWYTLPIPLLLKLMDEEERYEDKGIGKEEEKK